MTAVCTAFSDCGSFQNPSEDTSPILSLIKKSYALNWSKELDPFAPPPPLLMVTIQRNWNVHLSYYGVCTFLMFMPNSDWLARSSCKMTQFTIHYCVERWSFTLLTIFPFPTYIPSLPSIYLLLIFIPSIDWIVWRKRYGCRPVSTHTVETARKPHDAAIYNSSSNCHPYLLCCGDFLIKCYWYLISI